MGERKLNYRYKVYSEKDTQRYTAAFIEEIRVFLIHAPIETTAAIVACASKGIRRLKPSAMINQPINDQLPASIFILRIFLLFIVDFSHL